MIDPGAPAILGNTEVCGNVGTTLGIDPSPYDSFSWSTGAITPSITVVGPGVYSVYAVFGDCDYTSEIEVVDLASTIQLITIIGPSTITGTDPVQFTATPFLPDADSIVWTLPNGWVWGDDLDHFDAEALVIPASDAGEYTICATSYTEGCAGNELCYSTLVTGMFGILSNNMDVLAYPNPTTGLFTISCGSNSIPTDVRITDQLGRAVTTKQVRRTAGNLQLDMDGLAEGRYTIAFRVDGKLVRSAVVVGR
ncbi:MAG: T9SS type A sorting domain-containing protein [Flavobacteriales bacterium]|nr:T9SS type A sorting domain-containing protein [Flavobacteriales bacterium]